MKPILTSGALILLIIFSGYGTHGEEVSFPDSPAGERLKWAMEAVQPGATIEPGNAFASAFLELISAEAIIESITETSVETDGLRLLDVQVSSNFKLTAVTRARADESCWRIDIVVAPDKPHGITRIVYTEDPALGVEHGDGWPQIEARLEALSGQISFATFELRNARLTPIHQMNADAVLAIGSVFKLWVLGALAERIAGGEASWDDQLAIRDDWKSLPSGTMQELESGETRSLQEFAAKMISISDNTATDHLIHYLGRKKVYEFALAHGSPTNRNDPFLTTQEFFKLKIVADRQLRNRYVVLSTTERDQLLKEVIGPMVLPPDAKESGEPVAIDEIEYFASATSIAQLLVSLEAMSRQPGLAPVREVLTQNPGIKWDQSQWPTIAYKGGSEAGVLYAAWLMERHDGRSFVMCFGINDSASALNTGSIIKTMKACGALLVQFE